MIWYKTTLFLLIVTVVFLAGYMHLLNKQNLQMAKKLSLLADQHLLFMKIVYSKWDQEEKAKCESATENAATSPTLVPNADKEKSPAADLSAI